MSYRPTKAVIGLTDWWCILNGRLVDAGQKEVGFKEARECYEEGLTPKEAAIVIADARRCKEAVDRYLAITAWLRKRYTRRMPNGMPYLTINTGGKPSAYTRLESAFFNRYVLAGE